MTDYKKIREDIYEKHSKSFEKLHMSELSGNHHEFLSDWYRPARCTECGQTRHHNIHKTNTDE